MTTTALYDGTTSEYVIFSEDGGEELLTGKGSIDEFHHLCRIVRKAETIAAQRAVDQFIAATGDFMEKQRARQR